MPDLEQLGKDIHKTLREGGIFKKSAIDKLEKEWNNMIKRMKKNANRKN